MIPIPYIPLPPTPYTLPNPYNHMAILKPYYHKDITLFAETNFRQQRKPFGIKKEDRKKHMYIVGKTGMGKTSMLAHMIVQDMRAGNGLFVLDATGELSEIILHYVPESRVKDVVYFNPTDREFPFSFNLLGEVDDDVNRYEHMHLLVALFKDIWSDVWGSRFEYVLGNALITLLHDENNTLLHILPLFTDTAFREALLKKVHDPVLLDFWNHEFKEYPERFLISAIEPLKDKVGQIVTNPLVRNIIGQSKTGFRYADLLDQKKIVVLALNKNQLGVDIFKMLGAAFAFKLLNAAKKKKQSERDFYMYLDEFHRIALDSFSEFIETTDYGIHLILSNQYLTQVPELVRESIFGSVGTVISFRLSALDAEALATEFEPNITADELLVLPPHTIALRLLIDGEVSTPFSAKTLAPLPKLGMKDKVVAYSRQMHAQQRREVEEKIAESLSIRAVSDASPPPPQEKTQNDTLTTFREKIATVTQDAPVIVLKKEGKEKKAHEPAQTKPIMPDPPHTAKQKNLHEVSEGEEINM